MNEVVEEQINKKYKAKINNSTQDCDPHNVRCVWFILEMPVLCLNFSYKFII